MKAIVCTTYSSIENLEFLEIEKPLPKEDEVLIKIKACSVNFPDTLIVQGKYQFKPELPFSPGSDVAGVIVEVGEKVKNYKVGDEVFGFSTYGGFAEFICLSEKQVFPKLAEIDFKTAASFMLAYGTSYHALKDRARLKSGDTLVVLGAAGGVGLAAVELGKLMGAHVIACASSQEKLAICKRYGADELIDYSNEDLKQRIKELTEGNGADVIYDPVGGKYSEQAIRACAWKGRFLVVGFAAGEIPKIPLNLTLLKGCQIVGVFYGSFAKKEFSKNMQNSFELFQWLKEGKLKPYIHKMYPLENAKDALLDIAARKAMGKLIISME